MGKKTTARQFRLFKTECGRLRNLWGLTGWDYFVEIDALKDEVRAEVHTDPCQRSIWIRLADDCGGDSDAQLRAWARHEMIHALCEPLGALATVRYVTKDEVDAAAHEVLRRLNHLLPE